MYEKLYGRQKPEERRKMIPGKTYKYTADDGVTTTSKFIEEKDGISYFDNGDMIPSGSFEYSEEAPNDGWKELDDLNLPPLQFDGDGIPVLGGQQPAHSNIDNNHHTPAIISPSTIEQKNPARALFGMAKKQEVGLSINIHCELPTPASISFILENFNISEEDIVDYMVSLIDKDTMAESLRNTIKNWMHE